MKKLFGNDLVGRYSYVSLTISISRVSMLTRDKISHCDKKLAGFLFDFGVINTTDDDCEQQLSIVALRL